MTRPLSDRVGRHLQLVPTGEQMRVADPSLLTAVQSIEVARRTCSYRPTEYGNAQRLVGVFGADIRYVADERRWLIWKGSHWAPDVDGEMMRRAKTIARLLPYELESVEPHERERWLRHANASEKRAGLQAMIDLAASEKSAWGPGGALPVTCLGSDFDRDPLLLNCANGTVDLRTGELRPHDRADMLRRVTWVDYRPDATSRLWERFLDDSTGGDTELLAYLQMLAGATVIGTNDRDIVPVLSGPPGTGKSTLLGAMQAALGPDYATTASMDTFAERKASDAPREDVARLEGRRLVSCVEGEHTHTLAVGLLKRVAGGDEITARALYQSSRTFRPQMTVWLVVNEPPRIPRDETGLWRRLKVIPFENQVCAVDPGLRARLQSSAVAPAVLAWMVAGAMRLAALDGDLTDPDAVRESTQEYREEQSAGPLDEWLGHCCQETSADVLTPIADLRQSYDRFCMARSDRPISIKAWGAEMTRRFKKTRTAAARYYRGVELRSMTDDGS
jgi:putative DNA primase/helicase